MMLQHNVDWDQICSKADINRLLIDVDSRLVTFSEKVSTLLGVDTTQIPLDEFYEYIDSSSRPTIKWNIEHYYYVGRSNLETFSIGKEHLVPVAIHFFKLNIPERPHLLFGSISQIMINDNKSNHAAISSGKNQQENYNSLLVRNFIDGTNEVKALKNTLDFIASCFTKVSVAIGLYNQEKNEWSYKYESCTKDVQPLFPQRQNMPNTLFSSMHKKLMAGEIIVINSSEDLADNTVQEISMFERMSAQSAIIVPLISQETTIGFFIVINFIPQEHWSSNDIHWLITETNLINMCLAYSVINEKTKNHRAYKHDMMNNMPIGMMEIDIVECDANSPKCFKVHSANEYLLHLTHHELQESIGMKLKTFFMKDDILEELIDIYYELLHKKSVTRNFHIKQLVLDLRITFYMPYKGRMVAFIIDETDKNTSNKIAINRYLSMFYRLGKYAKIGYCCINTSTNEGYATDQWYTNIGESDSKSLKEIINNYTTIHPDDHAEIMRFLNEAKKGSTEPLTCEVRVKRPNQNHYSWIRTTSICVADESETGFNVITVNIDITDMKELQIQLVKARDHAQLMDNMKSAFLANMSHEIRTPLNAIVGFSDLIASSDNSEETNQYLSVIHDNKDLLLRLISDILDLSKIEVGTLEFIYTKEDVVSICHSVIDTFQMRDLHNLQLIMDTPPSHPLLVTDGNRLKQILSNFLSNAIKFTSSGSIHLGFEETQEGIRFYVTDTGMGISKENIDHIFDRFVKLNGYIKGTGLGLSISKSIIEHMGGKIGVISEEGKGSTFWILHPSNLKPQILATLTPNITVAQSTHQKESTSLPVILVGEANETNFLLLFSLLHKYFNLLWAKNGQELLSTLQQSCVDLILTDSELPVLSGLSAIRKIRQSDTTIPIWVVSAFDQQLDRQKAFTAGCNQFVPEPIDGAKLLSELLQTLYNPS